MFSLPVLLGLIFIIFIIFYLLYRFIIVRKNNKERFSIGGPLSQRFDFGDVEVPDVDLPDNIEISADGVPLRRSPDGRLEDASGDPDIVDLFRRAAQEQYGNVINFEETGFFDNFRFDPARVRRTTDASDVIDEAAERAAAAEELLDQIDLDNLPDDFDELSALYDQLYQMKGINPELDERINEMEAEISWAILESDVNVNNPNIGNAGAGNAGAGNAGAGNAEALNAENPGDLNPENPGAGAGAENTGNARNMTETNIDPNNPNALNSRNRDINSPDIPPDSVTPEVEELINIEASIIDNKIKNQDLKTKEAVNNLESEGVETSTLKKEKEESSIKTVVQGLTGAAGVGMLVIQLTSEGINGLTTIKDMVDALLERRAQLLHDGKLTPEDILNYSYEEIFNIVLTQYMSEIGGLKDSFIELAR